MRDLTLHRCSEEDCNRVARWTDGENWGCKDHSGYGWKYVQPPPPPPPPVHDYEVIGKASVRIRQRR